MGFWGIGEKGRVNLEVLFREFVEEGRGEGFDKEEEDGAMAAIFDKLRA